MAIVLAVGCGLSGCDADRESDRASEVGRPGVITDRDGGKRQGDHDKLESDSEKGGPSSGAALSSLGDRAVPAHTPPRFEDAAGRLGIDFTYYNDEIPKRYFLPEVMGGGLAWLDYDADGRLDLYAVNGCRLRPGEGDPGPHHNRLFRSVGDAGYQDVWDRIAGGADSGYGQGCAVGDFNVDGFPDIYVTNYGPNALLLNNGDGTFDNMAVDAGVADPLWGSSCLWCDLDRDGDLDLFVVNYLDVTFDNLKQCRFQDMPGYCGPGNYEGVPDRIYINEGDGRFTDGAERLGVVPAAPGKGLAIAALDLDNDGLAEIYVGNDMSPNFLYTRSRVAFVGGASAGGEPRPYREIAGPAACATSDVGHNEASMGIASGDYDRDGLCDLFLSHFYQQKNTLYRNLGGLLFKDDSRRARIAATSYDYLGFGAIAFDYDFDGWLDLFIANGHVLGPEQPVNEMTPQLLRNDGSGRFDDISAEVGAYFRTRWLGRGVAAADDDQDGDVDLAVSHLHKPIALLRNTTEARGHYLGISLGARDRIPPVGARVVVRARGRAWMAPYVSGGSYLSHSDPRLRFAVPSSDPVDVEVHWPDGRVDRWESIAADQYVRIEPGIPPRPSTVFQP